MQRIAIIWGIFWAKMRPFTNGVNVLTDTLVRGSKWTEVAI